MMRTVMAVSLLMLGCSEAGELKKFSEANAGRITSALEPLSAVPQLLAQVPTFETQTLENKPDVAPSFMNSKSNAMLVHLEDLASIPSAQPGTPKFRQVGDRHGAGWSTLTSWAHFAKSGEWEGSALHMKAAESELQSLERLRFVAVLRISDVTAAAKKDDATLQRASITGDVVLFDLREKKVVGGFPLMISGAEAYSVKRTNGPIKGMTFEEDVGEKGTVDLLNRVGFAVAQGLEQLVPGTTPPYLNSFYRKKP